ncbi:hypothetical protein [Nostoc sp. CHAB 5715]|uniref:hypothetical protein n=1 Tax=Nostoc sp. CHAB 5715 TaxID=2780400 RepID=UPI001E3F8F85|nr:hypothetical protein [Nostoc sp. CHAB 5715]MCC5620675.1 hypothetical protein [Nostoc sp. CHAB 5715]
MNLIVKEILAISTAIKNPEQTALDILNNKEITLKENNMNVTEINRLDIINHIEQNFDRTQTTGLNCLIFLALREKSTIAYQKKEWGFEDIPEQIIQACDSLEETELAELGADIAASLLDEIISAALDTKNAQKLTTQAIDDHNQPTLLSDY